MELQNASAHTPAKGTTEWHSLNDHLAAVAELAAEYGTSIGMEEVCRMIGILHDIGKARPEFQTYLRDCAAGRHSSGVNHKSYGAYVASLYDKTPVAPMVIQGHHSGIPARIDVNNSIKELQKDPANMQLDEALKGIYGSQIQKGAQDILELVKSHGKDPYSVEFMMRMIYSCLVDADSLDTEAHFEPDKTKARQQAGCSFSDLWDMFREDQDRLMANAAPNDVTKVRKLVYDECVAAASQRTGVFSLTVPTGCGKTRSSLAFALNHAINHGHQHIIYAIPYTSIVDQTVDVFSNIFADDHIVLEHHSAVEGEETLWQRLSAENWDVPIVVTTTVQLFESLFSNKPSKCRKNHQLAESVIILDEVQSMPVHLLAPTLNMLTKLVTQTKATVVLCTATQPAIVGDSAYLTGLPDTVEIISRPEELFQRMKRVDYRYQPEPVSWIKLAEQIRAHDQCLAIVNTKNDAKALFEALDTESKWHLSTDMCGAHRRACLNQVKERLKSGEPCVLVSTQVIEAGVDIDFPTVFRAVGPLDSIVQAAGRCNREGKHIDGNVMVFIPEEGSIPAGSYRTATDHAQGFLRTNGADMHDPNLLTRYFSKYYNDVDLDTKKIQDLRKQLAFPDVADKYQLIEGYNAFVVVPYLSAEIDIHECLDELRQIGHATRDIMRKLQPYVVQVRMNKVKELVRDRIIQPILKDDGIFEWIGEYDDKLGVLPVVSNYGFVV